MCVTQMLFVFVLKLWCARYVMSVTHASQPMLMSSSWAIFLFKHINMLWAYHEEKHIKILGHVMKRNTYKSLVTTDKLYEKWVRRKQ